MNAVAAVIVKLAELDDADRGARAREVARKIRRKIVEKMYEDERSGEQWVDHGGGS